MSWKTVELEVIHSSQYVTVHKSAVELPDGNICRGLVMIWESPLL